ncbi:MAG: hypothetical protein ACTHLH_08875 [Solirubrobacterales bacterium]
MATVTLALGGFTWVRDPGTAVAAVHALCTKQALTRGLKRGETPFRGGRIDEPWDCAGHFAYAAVLYKDEELTVLFRAVGRRWKTADRAKYCDDVPRRIWQPACNTN